MKKYRLAFLISHPIQYQSPLFRKLAAHPAIELTVLYGTDYGVTEKVDPGFGKKFKWDVPLLEGYSYTFLKNWSWVPHKPSSFFWIVNPGVFRELVRGRYDALIVHGYNSFTAVFAYVAAWFTRTPILMRGEAVLRPGYPWWLRAAKYLLLRPLFRGTSAFLSIGSRSEEFYRHYGVPQKKIFFTPYAVDNEFFMRAADESRSRRKALKADIGLGEHQPVILFVGKLIEKKRPMDLLHAYQLLITNYQLPITPSLLFVGDGPLRAELEAYAKEHEFTGVRFVGFKNQTELPPCYAIADVFVLPSGPGEVSPLVINEAMAAGLPVVVSDAVPSARDFVKEGENGYQYPAGDVCALADRLVALIGDAGRTARLGKRSREDIAAWNYDACVGGIVRALDTVVRYPRSSSKRI